MLEKKRLIWIDIAKGIGIILMMVGHYENYGSTLRNWIFSFHMPLFYILSGYTLSLPENSKELLKRFQRDIYKFIVPSFILVFFSQLIFNVINQESYENIPKLFLQRIFWGNGCDYEKRGIYFRSFGVMWFLNSIVISKLFFSFFEIKKKTKSNVGIYAIMAVLGIIIGQRIWLIQTIDISMVAVFFIYTGYEIRKNEKNMERYFPIIVIISALIWSFALSNGWYIEMATRMYPLGFFSCIEAICASFIVIECSKWLESNLGRYSVWISHIGRWSLEILFIHHFELFTGIYIKVGIHNMFVKIFINILIVYIMKIVKNKIIVKNEGRK